MARLSALALLLAGSVGFGSPRLFPELPLLSQTFELKVVEPRTEVLIATGAAAAFFVAPASLLLGTGVGKVSNNLYLAALPALLITLLLPPLAVVFTEWLAADRVAPGRFRWGPALGVAFLSQALVMAGAILLGVSGTSSAGAALFTLADAVALPTATTAMLKWTERAPTPSVPLISGNF